MQNYMEVLVDEIFSEVVNNYNLSMTEKNINDIKSLALNELTPMYFSSSVNNGEKFAFLLDKQRRTSVLAKVIGAIDVVNNNQKLTEKE